ncbi:alpha/beta-hydrolase [Podospora conica]|nr:alpha/beta-hydrolase [Schizothecium conicum]
MAWHHLLLALPLASALTPSKGCTNPTAPSLAAGNQTLTINDKPRWYLLHPPTSYTPSVPHRLVFTLHAMGGNASQVAAGVGGYLPWYGLPALDPSASHTTATIYAAPNGLNAGWANRGGEDVALITTIRAQILADYCVDEDLVFSVGFSYGSSMSYALACGAPDQFRAVGLQSGGNMSGCATGEARKPLALYGQHGVDGSDLNITAARVIRDQFVKLNGCEAPTGEAAVLLEKGSGTHKKVEYQGCREGFPVTWIEYDGGHTPQPKDKGAAATWSGEEVWKFFAQFK